MPVQDRLRFGNAPCSWGILEGGGWGIPYNQMLDELVETGYEGTELGTYGYMPTDPTLLRSELQHRGLTMLGAFVAVPLRERDIYADVEQQVMRVAHLLAEVADAGDPSWQPLLILADEPNRDPLRTQQAGRVPPQAGLSQREWYTFAENVRRIVYTVRSATGLETVFHPHCATYVETPDEIAVLLDLTEIGLAFDTGHYLYGSGTTDGGVVLEGLRRFRDRIRYVHLKDVSPAVVARARLQGWDYQQALAAGVFCELGQGAIDFKEIIGELLRIGYRGWITVEQDVLPGTGQPKESARRNREYLRAITGW